MLKQRLLTAFILIPLVIWGILQLSSPILAAMMGIFVIVGAWEWAGLAGWQNEFIRYFYATIVGLTLLLVYRLLLIYPQTITFLLGLAVGWWLIAFYWVLRYQQGIILLPTSPWIKSLLGFFILLPGWSALVTLHIQQSANRPWLLWLLILIWAADSAAYFTGKRWGKTKLADKVSPGKTGEGVAGALLISLVMAVSYAIFTTMTLSTLVMFTILCLLTVMASILGDLLESLFKRQMGLKDSSQILPGHGGILDRIDSITSAAPIFVIGLMGIGLMGM